MDPVFLLGCPILIGHQAEPGYGLLIEAGHITAILPDSADPPARRHTLPPEALLAPGLIDIQVNGGGGILFNDHPTAGAARDIARAHRRLGTTAIFPTLITSDPETFTQAATAARHFSPDHGLAGIHFEGPFLSAARPGVHRADLIRPPAEADLSALTALAATLPVLLTAAPEAAPAAIWDRLTRAGITLSAGHSAAHYEAVTDAFTGATHLFNAMSPPTARDPGLVAATLLSDRYAGIILDGHHVHPAMLRLLRATKAADRIILVSDAMSPAGTGATAFMLQGRRILRRGGLLTTEDGTLAGADLSLAQAMRNAITLLEVSREAAIAMASTNPASFLRLPRHGRIAVGYRADLILLTPANDVAGTWLGGIWEQAA
jgi:N-acetylglucosamine-6-phosphate deacetylase